MSPRRRKPLRSSPLAPKKGRRNSEESPKHVKKALRKGRINPRNKQRREKEWKRAYGSIERVRAIKSSPCYLDGCQRFAENAHLGNGGMSRKSDWTEVVDLCGWHHRDGPESLHRLGSIERFNEVHDTDLRVRARWLAENLPPDSPALQELDY